MPANHTDLEKRLWSAADELRANSKLKSSEYSVPVLGLIFLRYADHKFTQAKAKLTSQGSGRRTMGKADYQARGVLYLPESARFSTLLKLPEGADIGKAINDAMKAIEADNDDLKDVLPRTYNRLDKELLVSLLKNFAAIPMDIEGDAFGKIYEYFLGKFAMSEGQKGGEFFTPTSIVKLIVEIIEPFHGRIYDPACGSGGMFVQSAAFVDHHKKAVTDISIYGQENRTRMDFLEEFQKMIEEYNAGSSNVEVFFAKLMAFAKRLSEEEKRGLAEQLNEEELVIFDLLTKPEINLSKQETTEVKKVARTLLEKLKNEKLVLDWRKQQTTRAMVFTTIKDILDELPRAYTPELYEQKCDLVFQHVYEAYLGEGKSFYAVN